MMQMNRVVIAGYVSKKPELRHLPCDSPVANARAGKSVRYADGSGETREHTNWHSVSFYGKLADAQPLKKGENVYVDDRIEQRKFTSRDDSKPRTVHEIVVSQCHLIAPSGAAPKRRTRPPKKTLLMDHRAHAPGLKMTGQLLTNWARQIQSHAGGTISLLVLTFGGGVLALALAAEWAGLRLNDSPSMPTGRRCRLASTSGPPPSPDQAWSYFARRSPSRSCRSRADTEAVATARMAPSPWPNR